LLGITKYEVSSKLYLAHIKKATDKANIFSCEGAGVWHVVGTKKEGTIYIWAKTLFHSAIGSDKWHIPVQTKVTIQCRRNMKTTAPPKDTDQSELESRTNAQLDLPAGTKGNGG
jgi:hypothetical protein